MLPVLDNLNTFREMVRRPPFGLITDVDGTISPIAPTPAQAAVTPACRRYLARLYRRIALVALVSGRSAAETREIAGIEGPVYIGNHGLERWQDGRLVTGAGAGEYVGLVASAVEALARRLQLDGLIIERKGLSASVHYRQAPEPEAAGRAILSTLESLPEIKELRILQGKKVIDILPPLEVNKGTAVAELVREHRLNGAVYLGDDTTDIDAFRAVRNLTTGEGFRGLAVAVSQDEMPAGFTKEADFYLDGVPEVEIFLKWLARTAA